MTKSRIAIVTVRRHVRRAPGRPEVVIREYTRTLAALRRTKGDEHKQGAYDDLPGVKIASPAVKPKGVKPEQIRKAVRKAVQEFSERHSKALARS